MDARAIGLLVLLCALWGLQQVAVKAGIAGGLPPLRQAALRSIVALPLLAGWILVRHRRRAFAGLRRRGAWRAALLVGLTFGAEFIALYPGLRLTTASRGVLFLYTAPFFTALGAHLFVPGERLRLRPALGLVVAFGGVAIAFTDGLGRGSGSLAGDALCALAAIFWAASTIVIKASRTLARTGAAEVLFYQLGVSIPVLLVASLAAGEPMGLAHATALAWLALGYQAVVVATISYLAWFWLILTYPAGRIAGFTFLTPVFGIAFSALLLREPIGWTLVAGVAAIAAGLRLLADPA